MKTIINGHEIAGRMPLFQEWGRRAIRGPREAKIQHKTETRRVMKKQPPPGYKPTGYGAAEWGKMKGKWGVEFHDCAHEAVFYPIPIQVGDIRVMTEPLKELHGSSYYADDGKPVFPEDAEWPLAWRWKRDFLTSIHMPHEAARTLCEITAIRVERLHNINCGDCYAEGAPFPSVADTRMDSKMARVSQVTDWFRGVWDSINAKRGYPWSSNPFVIVCTFEVIS